MPAGQTDNTIGLIVGANLRAARLAKKYTQGKLAHPEFSISYISAIERGKIFPSLRAMEILTSRLDITSADLFREQSQDSLLTLATARQARPPDQHAIELELLEAQVAIRAGLYTQAIEQLHRLSTIHLAPQQQLQLKYVIGWAYAHTLQLQESEYMLREAERLAKDTHNALRLQILNVLGTVYASMQNYEQALRTHAEVLAQIERTQPQDPFFLAQVYINMGQHYTYLNLLDKAIAMFQQALAACEKFKTSQKLAALYANLCQGYAITEAPRFAAVNAYKLLQASVQQTSLNLPGEIHYYLGNVMLKGEQGKAYAYLEAALQQEEVQQNALALASVHSHLARWSLANAGLEEADKHAQKAYALVKHADDSLVTATTLITLGRVACAKKQYEAGDGYCEIGLEMLKALRARAEYFDQAAIYAQLLEDRGETTKALSYLKQAYALHQKMANNE